jgi:hypothetical protein
MYIKSQPVTLAPWDDERARDYNSAGTGDLAAALRNYQKICGKSIDSSGAIW